MSMNVNFNKNKQNVRVKPLKSESIEVISRAVYANRGIRAELLKYQFVANKIESLNESSKDLDAGKSYSLGKRKILAIAGVVVASILVVAMVAAFIATTILMPAAIFLPIAALGGSIAALGIGKYCHNWYNQLVAEEKKHTRDGIQAERREVLDYIPKLNPEEVQAVIDAIEGSIDALTKQEREANAQMSKPSIGQNLPVKIKKLASDKILLKLAIEDIKSLVKSIRRQGQSLKKVCLSN